MINFRNYLIINPKETEFNGNRIDLDNLPLVSFCIPTFNSSRTLTQCLSSIVNQKYPKLEIIIADNGSNDDTVKIAESYTEKIYFDDGLLGSVRQTTLDHSKGDIIALFDSDIIIPYENWLINSIKYFNYSENVSTVWPFNIAPPNAPWTTKLYWNLWEIHNMHRIQKGKGVFGGGNSLFLRNSLEKIGGINRNMHWGEDYEWAHKLKNNGFQVVAINDPLYHDTMYSLDEFRRKQFVATEFFNKEENINLMGLTKKDLIYENIVLYTINMFKGLFIDLDPSWLLFPVMISMRGFAFGTNNLKNYLEHRK